MIEYGSSSTTLLGGMQWRPTERFDLGLSLAWNQADAAMGSFQLLAPADFLARNPNMVYDFTRSWEASDLDLSRLEGAVTARYSITERFSLAAEYRYVDLQDDAPYLEDASGTVDFWSFGLGWSF